MLFEIPLNYHTLRKYHSHIDLLANQRVEKNRDISNVLHIVDTKHRTEEEYLAFNKEFEDLLTRYNLFEHKNSLLFLGGIIDGAFTSAELDRIEFKEAYQALKKLIKLLKIRDDNDLNDIEITVSGKRKGEKVVIRQALFIQQTLQPLIDNLFKITRSPLLDSRLHELLKDTQPTYKSLKEALDGIKLKRGNVYRDTLASQVLRISDYLTNETSLKAEAGKLISNEQARFIHDFFDLFELIDADLISSDPEDYIRSLISNHLK